MVAFSPGILVPQLRVRTDPSQIYLQDSNNEHTSPNIETEVNSNELPLIKNPIEGSSYFYDATKRSSHPMNSEQVLSSAADLNHENFKLPESNQRFLDKFELLLSEAEVRTFIHLYWTGNFTEPNLPYQSWLV